MADGEGGNGKTDGELMAEAVAEREAERLIQEGIAKKFAESSKGQIALEEAHKIAQSEIHTAEPDKAFAATNGACLIAQANLQADADKSFAEAKARAKAQAEQAVIDGTAKEKMRLIAEELAKRKEKKETADAYSPPLFRPDG